MLRKVDEAFHVEGRRGSCTYTFCPDGCDSSSRTMDSEDAVIGPSGPSTSLRQRRRNQTDSTTSDHQNESQPPTHLKSSPRSWRPSTSDLPSEAAAHSSEGQLWLLSRLEPSDQSYYRARGEDRPISIRNALIAASLIQLLWTRFLALFWEGQRIRVAAFLARRAIRGVLPACKWVVRARRGRAD